MPFYSWFTLPFSPLVNMRIIASPDKMSPLNSDAGTLVLFSRDLYTPFHVEHVVCTTWRLHHLESFSYVDLWMCVCNFGGMFSHREIEWVLFSCEGAGQDPYITHYYLIGISFVSTDRANDMFIDQSAYAYFLILEGFFIWTRVFFFSNDACVAPSQKFNRCVCR